MFEDLQSVVDSNFNASLKTKVLVHGYTGDGDQSWVIRMKAGFLEKGKASKTVTKGQIISKCPFGVIIWTEIPTEFFPGFLP